MAARTSPADSRLRAYPLWAVTGTHAHVLAYPVSESGAAMIVSHECSTTASGDRSTAEDAL